MINLDFNLTEPVKDTALDKRAIEHLKSFLMWEIENDENLHFTFDWLKDEKYYRILKIEGYENIVFSYPFDKHHFLESVQPIDRENDKLFPVQRMELQVAYKRF